MSDLPKGWAKSQFKDFCDIIGGSQPPKKEFIFEPREGYIRLIQIRDYKSDKHLTFIPIKSARRFCSVDDVMIGRYGPPLFQILRGIEGSYNVALMKAVPKSNEIIDNNFLFYLLQNTPLKNYIIGVSERTVGQDGVRKDLLEEYEISIPPLNEQKRIVTKLKALLSRVDASKERLEKIPKILKRFRQSVLAAACSGKLTADWRAKNGNGEDVLQIIENLKQSRILKAKNANEQERIQSIYEFVEKNDLENLPDNWSFISLNRLCESFNYGTSTKSESTGLVPVLRMGNLQNGELDWTDLVYTSDKTEIEKYNLKPNTVLFNRTNSPELVGKTSIYRGERAAIFAGYLIRINNFDCLDSEYLNYCLNTNYAREFCSQVKTDGVSQSNINAQKLGLFEIPFCPLPEQKEVVRRVEDLFKFADSIEERFNRAKAQVDKLTNSILAKAFRGELVEQDDADEPASVLLERIKAEKETNQAKTPTKRTSASQGKLFR